ncbi:aminoglycoside phosphotransferase family protein [Kribbella sp. NBC_00382]|uniref:aminoglycoside phosphotransferase family protein n=1 Tax=Kribbella sp. NBC_00382 TaxID=2975967 RepID=UPI002E208B5A
MTDTSPFPGPSPSAPVPGPSTASSPTSDTKTVEALVSLGSRYLGQVPAFEADRPWWSEVAATTRYLDELLGVPTFVLRLVHADNAELGHGGRVVFHVQATGEPRAGVLDPTPRPDWPDIIAPQPLRATWAEVDGPQRLVDWATGIVGSTGKPVQYKTWNLSCLIQLPGAGAWAKATSRFCSVDADVINHVHQYDEALAPAVLGVDLENRWSLLTHAPGTDCWEPDPETVQDIISRWVAVQAAIAGDELRVPRLLPADLPAELDRLLAGEVGERLSPAELSQVGVLRERLPTIVAELEAAGLPNTLVHGDFHPGNWRSDGTNRVIVDWADSNLGHPATDLQRLVNWLPPSKRPLAIQTWADAWQTALPSSDPLRALKPMAILIHLLGAATYQRFLDNIEPDERIYHEDDPTNEVRAAIHAAGY